MDFADEYHVYYEDFGEKFVFKNAIGERVILFFNSSKFCVLFLMRESLRIQHIQYLGMVLLWMI